MSTEPHGRYADSSPGDGATHLALQVAGELSEPAEAASSCCTPLRADEGQPGSPCGCGLDRRDFLKAAAGVVALPVLGTSLGAMAGPFSPADVAADHLVPADKRLREEWVRELFERGQPRVCRDGALNFIAMPVGGIAAGQMYLTGDGRLACWQIFNKPYFSGYGATNYQPRLPATPIAQGFALVLGGDGDPQVFELSRRAFPGVEFVAEYPLARVRYADDRCPVHVELSAYSPFIPLNANDSALPVTVLEYTLENAGDTPQAASLVGWLENAVAFHLIRDEGHELLLRSRLVADRGRTLLLHSAELPAPAKSGREDVVLADFEGETYGDWTAEGAALGAGPAPGTLPDQQAVTGFLGRGLVNTYLGHDETVGKLTSPPFEVSRRYLCFLIGGGRHPEHACINLLVDGQVVRTATGRNEERLVWNTWDLQEFAGRSAIVQIVDDVEGGWGHINVDHIVLTDRPRIGASGELEHADDYGTIALALDRVGATAEALERLLPHLANVQSNLCAATDLAEPSRAPRVPVLGTVPLLLGPGERVTVRFVLAWHFPNRPQGNRYAEWFGSAAEVAHYTLDHVDRLSAETSLWHDSYYEGTLPRWLLDRLHSTACNLATGTCTWWKDGRFWAWEGVGCCHGTCTHVWNYAHTLARLFPEMERSVREMQDLGAALHEDGLVGFRGERNKAYAADGQAGTVLKCYREHLCSLDDGFLRRNWPKIRKVLAYSITRDADADGLIEDTQHNTFDINFEGANTFVGSLYLAALRAGEGMAREMNDDAFADQLHDIFERGRTRTMERLWNGEYFIQQVDLAKHPQDQYADGCLSDQLFGQGWAHQLGLGYLYPSEDVRAALQSIWKYNWAPDVGPQNAAHKPERWFAAPGEAGLFTCTWPKSRHLGSAGVRYRDEIWTGIEYQVAGHMISEGMLTEGLAIIRAIHDRYDPSRRNPFNEVECGDHYARALASWGAYLALLGFECHGPRAHIGFAPRLSPEDFRAAFTAAEGWGVYTQRREGDTWRCSAELRWGKLRLSSVSLGLAPLPPRPRVDVVLDGRPVHATADTTPGEGPAQGPRLFVHLDQPVELTAPSRLEVSVEL